LPILHETELGKKTEKDVAAEFDAVRLNRSPYRDIPRTISRKPIAECFVQVADASGLLHLDIQVIRRHNREERDALIVTWRRSSPARLSRTFKATGTADRGNE
jgi:hypothetical protein